MCVRACVHACVCVCATAAIGDAGSCRTALNTCYYCECRIDCSALIGYRRLDLGFLASAHRSLSRLSTQPAVEASVVLELIGSDHFPPSRPRLPSPELATYMGNKLRKQRAVAPTGATSAPQVRPHGVL